LHELIAQAQSRLANTQALLEQQQAIIGFRQSVKGQSMRLYYSPGACSLAAMITAAEADIPLQLTRVDIRSQPHRLTEEGRDLREINPKNLVPVLELDDGQVLTEGAAILLYLADTNPKAGLAPALGTFERYRLQEWLSFVGSELHKMFSPWLFHPEYGSRAASVAKHKIAERFDYLEGHLSAYEFLVGERFSIADAYCFTIVKWTEGRGINLSGWPSLNCYHSRLADRPGVQRALTAEGLGAGRAPTT
jgi:glutathione S-transferase